MLPITTFTFKAHDGVHKYVYNPNSKLSSFSLIKNDDVLFKHDCFCFSEEYHIRRVLEDFNKNNRVLPNYLIFNIKYIWKHCKKDMYLMLSLLFLFGCMVFIYLVGLIAVLSFLTSMFSTFAR